MTCACKEEDVLQDWFVTCSVGVYRPTTLLHLHLTTAPDGSPSLSGPAHSAPLVLWLGLVHSGFCFLPSSGQSEKEEKIQSEFMLIVLLKHGDQRVQAWSCQGSSWNESLPVNETNGAKNRTEGWGRGDLILKSECPGPTDTKINAALGTPRLLKPVYSLCF